MMKFWILLLVLLVPVPAMAADTTCTIPDDAVSGATSACEDLRVARRVLAANWTLDDCTTEILRLGFREFTQTSTTDDSRQTVSQDVNNALTGFDTNFPLQMDQSFCGDSVVDSEFGEQCDNGVNDGTSCNPNCTLP